MDQGLGYSGSPYHCFDSGNVRISQVPGVPQYIRALLYDPGGTSAPGLLRRFSATFRFTHSVGFHNIMPFGAQSHGPHAPCVRFAESVALPHATLGSGCWPALPGGIVTRWGPS